MIQIRWRKKMGPGAREGPPGYPGEGAEGVRVRPKRFGWHGAGKWHFLNKKLAVVCGNI